MYKCHSVRTRLYVFMSMSMHRKKRVRLKNEQRYNCRFLDEKLKKKGGGKKKNYIVLPTRTIEII